MRIQRLAAILALGTVVTLGFAQNTQGTGNQRGAGTSADNSSNGGAGTTTPHKSKHHKKKAPTQDGSAVPAGSNTNPGGTPATGTAANGSTPPQL